MPSRFKGCRQNYNIFFMSRDEILVEGVELGKYSNIIHRNGKNYAQIYYRDDGSINEESTYSDFYKRKNKIGRYANESDDESKAKKERKKSKKEGGGSSGCCSICKCIWKIFKCFC